jgi:hypothetical protein
MKLVKEEVQTLEASKPQDSTRFPPAAQSPYRPVRVSLQQHQAGRAGGEWGDQLMRHIPANFARRKLSELSVSSVCALLTELLEEPEEGEEDGEAAEPQISGHIEAAIRVIRSNHISGRVLAACDLDELRAVLGLNFGDWNLFRLAVLSLRQLDLNGQLLPEDATAGEAQEVERRRKTAVIAARGPAVSSSVQASVTDPNPDPRVFWPPGSGSFYHHAKIMRKILNPTILWLFVDFLSLKNNVNVP